MLKSFIKFSYKETDSNLKKLLFNLRYTMLSPIPIINSTRVLVAGYKAILTYY